MGDEEEDGEMATLEDDRSAVEIDFLMQTSREV